MTDVVEQLEEPEIELNDTTEYLNESHALEQIKQILAHPGIRDPANLQRRLWLYLHTVMGPRL